MSLRIYGSDFLITQVSHSKNGLQSQLISYDESIDADPLNESLTLSVNGLLQLTL